MRITCGMQRVNGKEEAHEGYVVQGEKKKRAFSDPRGCEEISAHK